MGEKSMQGHASPLFSGRFDVNAPFRQAVEYVAGQTARNLGRHHRIAHIRAEAVNALRVAPGADGRQPGHIGQKMRRQADNIRLLADNGVKTGHRQEAPVRPVWQAALPFRCAEFVDLPLGFRVQAAYRRQMFHRAAGLPKSVDRVGVHGQRRLQRLHKG